jgi:hypothetical protein
MWLACVLVCVVSCGVVPSMLCDEIALFGAISHGTSVLIKHDMQQVAMTRVRCVCHVWILEGQQLVGSFML